MVFGEAKREFYSLCHAAHASTQLALQLQQERIQVVHSNKVVRRIPTESNSTPAMDLGHMNVVLKWCVSMLIVELWIGMIIIMIVVLFLFLSVFLFVVIKPENPYCASRLGLEVKPLGVYPLGPPSSSCCPTKGTPPPKTTLRAN